MTANVRGRVRKAPRLDVSAFYEGPGTQLIDGGWVAEIIGPDGDVIDHLNKATWWLALTAAWALLRTYGVRP